MVQFPQLTDEQVKAVDFFNNNNALLALDKLQNLPYMFMTPSLAAGASGATTTDFVFVAPCKGEILQVKVLTTVVQTGSGNTPVAKLVNGTTDVAATAAIALGGAIGDVATAVIDAAEAEFAAGDKLKFSIVNPAGTITVALTARLQIIWKPKA